MRIAVLDREKCHPESCGYVCMRFCPGVRMGEETITAGEKAKETGQAFPVISEKLCRGCGICVKKCPSHAIEIINLPEEMGKPLHQYGVNAFRIYGFPSISKGVTALVGPNGIGKSTILKILAGSIVPNLGDLEKSSWENVIEHFRGKITQAYFEKVKKGEARVAYKPQDVDRIPKSFSGKVGGLLRKTDDRGAFASIAKKLELENCLDKKLGELSGGELQRVAIAATAMRESDFYFFDEPSSFLDVRQRLNAASVIKGLGGCVLVVEHDLAVLDYLADYVHVLYGKPGVYGVVSAPKSARVGINEFLEGFLKAENTRIREYPIRFEVKPPASEWKGKKTKAYGAFGKMYPAFSLAVEAGELREGEVLGILGPNAIGKSTFMKILAGVEKQDTGDPEFKAKIAYKPQYITSDFPGTALEMVMEGDIDREFFESEIKRFVEDLFEKKVVHLSGGELQRLSIAIALSRNADACLLDEPSAFLDVEQRLALAQLVKRVAEKREITTLVVDHDIVFQDFVANRISVFEGTPGKEGVAHAPEEVHTGMNRFLKDVGVTFRRDPDSGRPRSNKPGSQKDGAQKAKGEYYYMFE